MRVGRFQIEGDEPYQSHVASLLRDLVFGFSVSRYLTMHLRHDVLVRRSSVRERNYREASTVPENGRDALPAGQRRLFSTDLVSTAWNDVGLPVFDPTPGTGRGTGSRIDFTPSDFVPSNTPVRPGNVRYYEDAVFVHEIMHAVRFSWGVSVTRRFDDDRSVTWGMGNTEEFYATIAMNMYASQRRLPFCASYEGALPARMIRNDQGLMHPYVRLERRWIGQFFRDIPTLANALGGLNAHDCPYNPFRQFLTMDYSVIPEMQRGHRPAYLVGPPAPDPPLATFDDILGRR